MRYFIDVVTENVVLADQEGTEFLDFDETLQEAAQIARELTIEELRHGRPVPIAWQVEIRDADRRILGSCSLRDLVVHSSTRQLWNRVRTTVLSAQAAQKEIEITIAELREQLRALAPGRWTA